MSTLDLNILQRACTVMAEHIAEFDSIVDPEIADLFLQAVEAVFPSEQMLPQEAMPGLIGGEQWNHWLPGEEGRSGVYADDNGSGAFLKVFTDEQGDVWLSVWGEGKPMVGVRFVGHGSRRLHVLLAAHQLARALHQEVPAAPQQEWPR